MTTNSVWTWVTTITAWWISLIAVKIDIYFALWLLIFFSIIHSLIVLHFERKIGIESSIANLVIGSVIAFALWIVAGFFWVWRDFSEIQIYIAMIIVSLTWIKLLDIAWAIAKKKYWINIDPDELFDNRKQWNKK